jgi:hypothetical protein
MLDNLPHASLIDALSKYLDRWAAAHLSCEAANRTLAKVGAFAEVFWKEVIVAATQLTDDVRVGAALHRYDACRALCAAVDRVVGHAATRDLARLAVRARHVLMRFRGMPRLLPRGNFDEMAIGLHDLAPLVRRL